jgi:opacity protein-like surface antigen
MKKIAILAILISISLCVSAQRHRLSNGEPYDIFLSVRPSFVMLNADLDKNYQWGVTTNFVLEFQLQETKLGFGAEIGYNYFNPKSYKLDFLPRKYLWSAHQVPLTVYCNYYFTKNEKLKPYIGLGLGVVYGVYDYSLSSPENMALEENGYYLREYEGQGGWHFGVVPRLGFMFTLNHKHAFGIEAAYQYYLKNDRMEQMQNMLFGLTYTFIID